MNQPNENPVTPAIAVPVVMDAKAIKAEFFSNDTVVNLPAIYAMFRQEGFPAMKIGKRLYTIKHLFMEWLEEQVKKGVQS